MQNLIESLLNYSSMDASEIHFVPTDLNTAIDDIKNNMTDILEKRMPALKLENCLRFLSFRFNFSSCSPT
ncbi:hypothetical protein H9W95_15320 [Flavobacterium lindanitolerans]|nr:hypothetical protein [Flavobacterium lindanitolerans]